MSNRDMPSLLATDAPEKSGESDLPPKADAIKKRKGPITVIALAKGFFKQHRKNEGDEFQIEKVEQLGSWMKCKDPTIQKEHLAAIAARKEKLKAGV